MPSKRPRTRNVDDLLMAGFVIVLCLIVYVGTAAPSVATIFDDSLEFQVVLPTLGIAHPSGYPLYTLLGKLAVHIVPWRDPAGRINLFSALAAATAMGVMGVLARRLAGSRPAALLATLGLAISPAWWSQAVIAEVYALHGALTVTFLYLLLRWEEEIRVHSSAADRFLAGAALVAGLGLAHHRMIGLLLPGALLFIFWTDASLIRAPRRWLRPLMLGLSPLLLYLYLPWRGQVVSSLDCTYSPTLQGTLDWILARDYAVFLTGNPFGIQRTAGDYVGLFFQQFGALFLLSAVAGLVVSARRNVRRTTWLLISTITVTGFGVAYRVEDVAVFLLPAFILTALWAAIGLAPLCDGVVRAAAAWSRSFRLPPGIGVLAKAAGLLLVAVILLAEPGRNALERLPELDRSADWRTYDYGRDILAQPDGGGVVIGLLGETTLVRYFRDVLGERPDIEVVAADDEGDRLRAVERWLATGRPVYLTRDLPGASSRYSLDAAGPLIRVSPKASAATATAGRPVGQGIALVDLDGWLKHDHRGTRLRLVLSWAVSDPVQEDLKVSARLVDAQGEVIVAEDSVPVHFAYPTSAWVPGEVVDDVYDLPLGATTLDPTYRLLLILYRAETGEEVGRALLELPVNLT